MNTIENLFYGNINPIEKSFKYNSKYRDFMSTLVEKEGKLIDFLKSIPNTEEEQLLFEEIMKTRTEQTGFYSCNYYMDGFRLGANIMLDTFVVPQKSVLHDISQ